MSLAELRKIDRGRRHLPLAISTARSIALTPGALDRDPAICSAPTSRCSSTNARPGRSTRGRAPRLDAAVDALGRTLQGAPSASGRARRCSASCRAASIRDLRAESGAGADRHRLRRLRRRRARGRRGPAGDVRGARRDDAAAARRPAALSDGRGQAGRYRRRGAARHRHVRLRAADALGPHGQAFTAAARSICATPAIATTRGRSTSSAPVPPAAHYSRAYLHHLSQPRRSSGRCC